MSSEQDQANPPPYKRREVIGEVTIYLGDCRKILPFLEPVHHIISDPPYEEEAHTKGRRLLGKQKNGSRTVEYGALDFAPITDELRTIFCEEAKLLCAGWVLAFCQAEAIADWRDALVASGCKWKRAMIWLKPDGAPQFTGDRPGMGYESIAAGWAGDKRSKWNGGGKHGVFCHAQRDNNHPKQHMTQKPLKLMRELVSLFTDHGQIILDPFLGSGTTAVACAKLGRRCIGIEIDESFFEIACQRVRDAYAQGDMFMPVPPSVQQEAFL